MLSVIMTMQCLYSSRCKVIFRFFSDRECCCPVAVSDTSGVLVMDDSPVTRCCWRQRYHQRTYLLTSWSGLSYWDGSPSPKFSAMIPQPYMMKNNLMYVVGLDISAPPLPSLFAVPILLACVTPVWGIPSVSPLRMYVWDSFIVASLSFVTLFVGLNCEVDQHWEVWSLWRWY